MSVNSIAETQEKKSYEINKTTSIENQKLDSTNEDKKNDNTAVIATISEDGKNRYVNDQETLINKIEKEKSLLSSNYYLKQEDQYYYCAIQGSAFTDCNGDEQEFLKEDPKVLANKSINAYSKLYNEIMQENTDETVRNKKLKDLDDGYQFSINNFIEGKNLYEKASLGKLIAQKKIYAITHRAGDFQKIDDAQKELDDYTKYDIPKDFVDKSMNAVKEFKINYNTAFLNHEDINKFISQLKIYETVATKK